MELQGKLLRVLQDGEFSKLGSSSRQKVDLRFIAATNKNLTDAINKGTFREDLYYRLMVVPIQLPPLRDKPADIPILVDYFLNKFSVLTGRNVKGLTDEALNCMKKYDWPGNIRELENIIEHAFVMCRGSTIRKRHLPDHLLPDPAAADAGGGQAVAAIAAEATVRPEISAAASHLSLCR